MQINPILATLLSGVFLTNARGLRRQNHFKKEYLPNAGKFMMLQAQVIAPFHQKPVVKL